MPRCAHRSLVAGLTLLALAAAPACDKEEAGTDKSETAKQVDAKASKKADAKAPGDADAKAPVDACGPERGKALEQEMQRGCAIAPRILQTEVPPAPWKVQGEQPERPPHTRQIALRTDGVYVGANERLSVEQWGAELPPRDTPQERLSWELSIEPDVPGAMVAAALGHLATTGNARGSIVLSTPAPADVPTPRDPERLARLHTEMQNQDPSTRATNIARQLEQAMPPCPEIEKAFSAVASAAPEHRCSILARGFGEAMTACNCPEMDEVLTLVYGIAVDSQVPTELGVAVPTTIDPSAKPHTGATWGEIVAGLDEAAFSALAITAP